MQGRHVHLPYSYVHSGVCRRRLLNSENHKFCRLYRRDACLADQASRVDTCLSHRGRGASREKRLFLDFALLFTRSPGQRSCRAASRQPGRPGWHMKTLREFRWHRMYQKHRDPIPHGIPQILRQEGSWKIGFDSVPRRRPTA